LFTGNDISTEGDLPDGEMWFQTSRRLTGAMLVLIRYMAISVSGQDESNPVRAGKMELPCPLGTTRRVLAARKNFLESHIINPLLTKFVWSR